VIDYIILNAQYGLDSDRLTNYHVISLGLLMTCFERQWELRCSAEDVAYDERSPPTASRVFLPWCDKTGCEARGTLTASQERPGGSCTRTEPRKGAATSEPFPQDRQSLSRLAAFVRAPRFWL
jgi:hypothetical protein